MAMYVMIMFWDKMRNFLLKSGSNHMAPAVLHNEECARALSCCTLISL